jgi:hypothetical protein
VSGLYPQSQTSLLHQQCRRCGFQGSGDSSQSVVVLGLLGGREGSTSSEPGVMTIHGKGVLLGATMGGVMALKANAAL